MTVSSDNGILYSLHRH